MNKHIPQENLADPRNINFVAKLWPKVVRAAMSNGQININKEVISAVLHDTPSDWLISRKLRRELRNLLTPLVEFVESGAEILVKCILEYHEDMLLENGTVCRLGKNHDILYIAATFAETYNVTNNNLIAKLITTIFYCEKCFDRFVAPAILGPKVSYILSGWRPDIDSSERALTFLCYFIKHSNKAKLLFKIQPPSKNYRFLDVPLQSLQQTPPITAAVQANNLNAVKIILQQGLCPDNFEIQGPLNVVVQKLSSIAVKSEETNQPNYFSDQIVFSGLSTLSKHNTTAEHSYLFPHEPIVGIQHREFYLEQMEKYSSYQHEKEISISYPKDVVDILNLLKDCPTKVTNSFALGFFHPRLLLDGLLSLDPPLLKHLCRSVIRQSLYENWKLPDGIGLLKVPIAMENYLNFETEIS